MYDPITPPPRKDALLDFRDGFPEEVEDENGSPPDEVVDNLVGYLVSHHDSACADATGAID
jgi:hypothetical protein